MPEKYHKTPTQSSHLSRLRVECDSKVMPSSLIVKIPMPAKVSLHGIWLGSSRAKRAIVWVHGLGSSAFSMLHIVEKLVNKDTAVLTFNNRGHDVISRLSTKKKGKPRYGGAAHEVFTECVDDIDGAIRFAKKQGAKEIYLAGHSTGCQKSIYWAAKKGQGVKGIILLAPVSDWAAEMKRTGKKKILRAVAAARQLVKKGKKHELLPSGLWHSPIDAQRLLSLCTPESVEEIFPYSLPMKKPTTLQKVRVPILVLWADRDEFSDKSSKVIAQWFTENAQSPKSAVHVIPKVGHSFKRGEVEVSRIIKRWLSQI